LVFVRVFRLKQSLLPVSNICGEGKDIITFGVEFCKGLCSEGSSLACKY
jgi:hypothetical protein